MDHRARYSGRDGSRVSLRSPGMTAAMHGRPDDVLPRGRPIQDKLRQRPGGLPPAAGPRRDRRDPARCLCGDTDDPQRLPDQRDHDAVPDLHAGGDRAQYPHRLYRAAVARHRRVHGRRGLRLLQAHHLFPERERPDLDHRLGLRLGGSRRDLRPAGCAHQRLLSRDRDACRAVLSRVVLHAHSVAL